MLSLIVTVMLALSPPRLSPSPICTDCRAPITPPGGQFPAASFFARE